MDVGSSVGHKGDEVESLFKNLQQTHQQQRQKLHVSGCESFVPTTAIVLVAATLVKWASLAVIEIVRLLVDGALLLFEYVTDRKAAS